MFVADLDGNLRAFRASDGTTLWSKRANGRVLGPTLVVGDLLFYSTLEGRTYGVRVQDGEIRWHFRGGKYAPGIATSDRYYLSLNGLLVAFKGSRRQRMTTPGAIDRAQAWIVLGALGAVVTLNIGVLGVGSVGSSAPVTVTAEGPLGFLVSLAGGEWDLGLIRSAAMLAGVLVVALATAACLVRVWRAWVLVLACFTVVAALVLPGVALQVGLRDATAPWFYTNDSTYQIELAGEIVRAGHTPYGHDYFGTGLERFYSLDRNESSPESPDRRSP